MAFEATRFLEGNHRRRRDSPLEIDVEFPHNAAAGRILLLMEREELHGRALFLESLGVPIIRGIPATIEPGDIAICIGHSALLKHAAHLRRSGIERVVMIEAGFLRGVLLDNSASIYDQSLCFFVDDLGFHFDPARPTRLEVMLNDPGFNLTDEDLARAARLRRRIVDARLTKYNDQLMTVTLAARTGPRVLVVEQARNDWAVLCSGGSRRSFVRMLERALEENPDAEILVKVHPDSLDGKRGGVQRSYFGRMQGCERITIIREKVNPFSLLEMVDKVYVFSSMLGFEAALMGKEVHVFGKPCYAGWGVTHDRQRMRRRARRRSLDELVYTIYFAYQKYKNLSGEWCSAEEAIDILLDLRERYMTEVTGAGRTREVAAA